MAARGAVTTTDLTRALHNITDRIRALRQDDLTQDELSNVRALQVELAWLLGGQSRRLAVDRDADWTAGSVNLPTAGLASRTPNICGSPPPRWMPHPRLSSLHAVLPSVESGQRVGRPESA